MNEFNNSRLWLTTEAENKWPWIEDKKMLIIQFKYRSVSSMWMIYVDGSNTDTC